MNDPKIETIIDAYYKWLKEKTTWRSIDEYTEITTPYLDRNNDYIQFYLKKSKDNYVLTDGGSTISSLIEEGCSLEGNKRQKILKQTLNGYGVALEYEKLVVRATDQNLPLKKHSLIQAIIAINDMFYLAEPHVLSLFLEDVRDWLELSDIRFTQDISFTGHSGFSRKFDFIIPKSNKEPERILKTINNPVKGSIDSLIMDWLDTKDARQHDSIGFAIVNDTEKKISGASTEALENYGIQTVPWSIREEYKERLVA